MADSWKTWQEALEEVNLARFLHYRDFLSALYLHLKGEIKGFSYLQFAAALGLGSNNSILRLVIAGKRRLTPRAAERIGEHLRLSGTRRRYWLTLVRYNTAKDPGEADRLLQRLMKLKTKLQPEGIDETRLAYFAEWYHPVIREMAARPDFQMDARWIQSRIGFPVRLEDIKKSLELLTRLGLIHFDARSDSWVRSDEPIDTGPEARGIAFIRYHQKMIGLGSQAIDHMDRDEREVIGATLSLSVESMKKLRQRVCQLVDEAVAMEAAEAVSDDDQVVQLNVQLFPFTRG